MAAVIYDLEGNGEKLTGFDTIEEIERVNGEREVTFVLHRTRQNAHYFGKIAHEWRLNIKGQVYVIKLCRKQTVRDDFSIEIGALHSFYDDMRNDVVNATFSGSRTFNDILTFIFQGSGYGFTINGAFAAQSFENFGDDYRLELFSTALDRYKAEFQVEKDLVIVRPKIGQNRSIQFRQPYNITDVDFTTDSMDFVTYGQAFGAPRTEGGTDYISTEYRSPLADVYGLKVIKSIRDERFRIIDNLYTRLKEAIDESLKLSISLKYWDLNEDNAKVGDTVLLFEKSMDIKTTVRIVEIKRLLNYRMEVVDSDVTLSNFENLYEQQKRMQKATKAIADAIEGRRPLPFDAMTYMVQIIANDINNSKSQIEYPESGGIILRDPEDPNALIRLESRGIGLSTDNGETYLYGLTGRGMLADILVAGTIFTQNVKIQGPSGNMYMDGDEFIARSNDNPNRYARITPGNVDIEGGAFSLKREDGYTLINNGMANFEFSVQFTPTPWISTEVERSGVGNLKTSSTGAQDIAYGRFKRDGQYLKLTIGQRVEEAGETCIVQVESTGNRVLYLRSTETTTSNDYRVTERTVIVDFGVPDGSHQNFYITMRSQNGTPVFARVVAAWVDG